MQKRTTVAGSLWGLLVATCCLTGCSQASPEAAQTETDLSHHKKTHANHSRTDDPSSHNQHAAGSEPARAGEAPGDVAEKAKTVLKYIDEHHEAPKGYEGGRAFHNSGGSEEQLLPKHDDRGRAVTYQEWDVNRKVEGVNRGTERLITGSDGSAYVTADHYKTFTKVR